MARKRSFTTFNLSFLDVMSCGFGAVILIFLIIDHASDIHAQEINQAVLAEVNMLETEIVEGRENLARTKNTIDVVDQQVVDAEGESRRILEQIKQLEEELADLDAAALARVQHVNSLKSEIRKLEDERKRAQAEAEEQQGSSVREVEGEGDRQYLTGLKLGGRRILILLDASSSMLDRRLVNIIRKRNMPDEVKRKAEKWQRAVRTVDWLTAQLPRDSEYQLYTFNTTAEPVIADTDGLWLAVSDREQLDEAVDQVKKVVPNGGTSLENLFSSINDFSPPPDNIMLITDGLPTQGEKPAAKGKVTGEQRLKLFNVALRQLPPGIPVNVILAPMEGDPLAAGAFWKLALATNGSFLSPSPDWP